MKVRIECEIEIVVPDTTTNIESEVSKFMMKASNVPFGIFRNKLKIMRIQKIEPWEESLSRFESGPFDL